MNRFFIASLLAAAIATPALAADDHKPKHGGVVVETKAGDMELVASPTRSSSTSATTASR